MEISCRDPVTGPSCGNCKDQPDEIAHAALIPVGSWPDPSGGPNNIPLAGKVLVWTRCDLDSQHETGLPDGERYRTHIWDPNDPDGDIVFHPRIVSEIQNGNGIPGDPDDDGPFCAGHTWILDDNDPPKPKLLVVGGNDRGDTVCDEAGIIPDCALHKAYWFDPLASNEDAAWSDDPADLRSGIEEDFEGLWYPSVITYLDEGNDKFHPIVFGGSGAVGNGCDEVPPQGSGIRWEYDKWWTLSQPYSSSWTSHTNLAYKWQQYPRAFVFYDGMSGGGDVFTIGNTIICEEPWTPSLGPYGGNPANLVQTPTQQWSAGEDPNPPGQDPTVGGLHYGNAVIFHTLVDETEYANPPLSSHYHLNRIIVTGGQEELFEGPNVPTSETDMGYQVYAQPHTYELQNAPNGPWIEKNSDMVPRVYANFVPLPDGRILLVGGQDRSPPGGIDVEYYDVPELFNPQGPFSGAGVWTPMARRPIVGNDPFIGDFATPRGYHSVALLLQDGTVALMGGQEHGFPYGIQPNGEPFIPTNSMDTVEIFKPSYTFYDRRLKITNLGATGGTIHYGKPFAIEVNRKNKVRYACLLGIGSVTHHFDYGQRYIELMTEAIPNPPAGNPNLNVLAPPEPAMAPEGYYLLFVVELRNGVKVPSKGSFIRLTFEDNP